MVIIGVVDDGENQVITTVILLNKTVENTRERPGINCVQKKVFTQRYMVAKSGVCMTKWVLHGFSLSLSAGNPQHQATTFVKYNRTLGIQPLLYFLDVSAGVGIELYVLFDFVDGMNSGGVIFASQFMSYLRKTKV